MVGLRQLATRSAPIVVKSLENMSMKVFGCISLMSAPAAKAFSPPASRMHPIPSSASRSSTAAAISRNTPKDSALSIFGRLSVIMPTAPLLSTMMCSNVLMVHPAPDFAGNVPAGGMGFKWRFGWCSRHPEERALLGARLEGWAKRSPTILRGAQERAPQDDGGTTSRHEH